MYYKEFKDKWGNLVPKKGFTQGCWSCFCGPLLFYCQGNVAERGRISIWLVTCQPVNDLRTRSPPLANFHVPVVGKERPLAGGQARVNLTFMCGGPDYCTDVILSPYDSHADPLVCDSPVPPGGWIPCYLVDFGLGSVILFGQWKHMSRSLQCALLGLPALPPSMRVAYATYPGCCWSQNEWCVDGPGPNLQLKGVIQHTWTPVSKK